MRSRIVGPLAGPVIVISALLTLAPCGGGEPTDILDGPTLTATAAPAVVPTATAVSTATVAPTPAPPQPTATPVPSRTAAPASTATPTSAPTAAPTASPAPTATPAPIPTSTPVGYALNVSVSPSGTVTLTPPGGSYAQGTVVTLKATPALGCIFDRWEGDASGSSATIAVTMDSAKSVVAYFKPRNP